MDAQYLPVNPPDWQPPGETTVLVRRQFGTGAADSLHLYLHRRTDNTWRVVGALLDIPYYDAPALADVRAAPAAFAGREVVMTGVYLTSAPGDLPADAPRLGQWVLRDDSGASVWVRNASANLTQDLQAGSDVQIFGRLKMEQGWPFLEVRSCRRCLQPVLKRTSAVILPKISRQPLRREGRQEYTGLCALGVLAVRHLTPKNQPSRREGRQDHTGLCVLGVLAVLDGRDCRSAAQRMDRQVLV